MGLEQGAPIPEKGKPGQFMQDAQGNVVISKLDEQTLQDIAKAGEGLYIRASNTEVGLNGSWTKSIVWRKACLKSGYIVIMPRSTSTSCWWGCFSSLWSL